jgi:branched-chain amino acid transport system ATP-binding protein
MASALPKEAPRAAASPAGPPLLVVRDLQAWYGESHILHGVAFDVAPSEVVTLLGMTS